MVTVEGARAGGNEMELLVAPLLIVPLVVVPLLVVPPLVVVPDDAAVEEPVAAALVLPLVEPAAPLVLAPLVVVPEVPDWE